MPIETKDLAAFTGILATLSLGIYNAIQNYRSSQRTSFINTVTSERVKWIEKLRQSISSFCGAVHYWRFSTTRGGAEERQKIEEIDILRHLIVLQLSPTGTIDRDIQALVGKLVSITGEHIEMSPRDFREILDQLTKKTQELLKAEWEKVKAESRKGDLVSENET
jgi:hypothetical protein